MLFRTSLECQHITTWRLFDPQLYGFEAPYWRYLLRPSHTKPLLVLTATGHDHQLSPCSQNMSSFAHAKTVTLSAFSASEAFQIHGASQGVLPEVGVSNDG